MTRLIFAAPQVRQVRAAAALLHGVVRVLAGRDNEVLVLDEIVAQVVREGALLVAPVPLPVVRLPYPVRYRVQLL